MSSNVEQYMMANGKFFADDKLPLLKDKLKSLDGNRFSVISALSLKDPTIILVAAVLGGIFGADRFMLGQTGLGIAKLLTLGGCGVWSVIDWFTAAKRAKEANYELVMSKI